MIDNYLLEELVAFKKYGTLAATAENLMVTQPTVTRGMQKLEEEFGVKIFNRQPNKISLTKTGELAVKEAQKIIDPNNAMVTMVQNFDHTQHNIKIASVAPGPLILADYYKKHSKDNNLDIDNDLLEPADISDQLQNNSYSLIFTNQEIITDSIESRFIGSENLSVNLNKFTLLANKKSVSFKDLKGLSFIVLSDIGIWKKVAEDKIPDAKFLYQNQAEAFKEITKYSDFPYFTTDISKLDTERIDNDNDQIEIPINDQASKIDFYAAYLKTNRDQISPLLTKLNEIWTKKISK